MWKKLTHPPVLTGIGLALLGVAGIGYSLFSGQSAIGWGLTAAGSLLFLFKGAR